VHHELLYWPAADDAIARLEADPALRPAMQAVDRTLVRLADDPFAARLGTAAFVTDEFGGICATPARFDDWYVLWQKGEPGTIEIVHVCQLQL
jgi:hypothetical protein